MIELISELHASGINVLPLKYDNGSFQHPSYAHLFDKGYDLPEIIAIHDSGYNNAIGILHGKCNPDLVCLDFDEKNAPGRNLYDHWKNLVDDILLQKLVIEKTRSNGYHVYFKCAQLPTTKALANGSDGAEWIACRSARNNCITYCAPSKGYDYLQGSLEDIQYIDPREMAQLLEAAAHLNEYSGARTAKDNYLPSPMPPIDYVGIIKHFDDMIPGSWVTDTLFDMGWSTDGVERQKNVNGEKWYYMKLWRPGKDIREPYSANFWLTKKRLSVFSASTPFPCFDSGSSFMHSPSRVAYYLSDGDWRGAIRMMQEVCKKLGLELPKEKSLVYSKTVRNREQWYVEHSGVVDWATRKGYQWLRLSADDDSIVQFIRVVDNVIFEVDEKDLMRDFWDEINKNYTNEGPHRVLAAFAPQVFKYMGALPKFDGKLMRDTDGVSYIYFNNGALRVTSEAATLIKYSELDGCVFARHIKNFDYEPCNNTGVFGQFMEKISEDPDHLRFIKSALGYILHYHKLKNFAKALVLVEDVEDNNEAMGRSGKGLIVQFVEWLRWTIQQDGRNFKTDSQFKMQRVVPGVQVYYLNDPSPTMLYSQFYNYITDDWLVESKGKKSYNISFENSPKIIITTNYSPELNKDSDKDRFIKVIIKKEFGSEHRIEDAFPGVIFFSKDWERSDRNGAIRFAIECLQLYFKNRITKYYNEKHAINDEKRIISSSISFSVADTLEFAIETAKSVDTNDQFKYKLEKQDLRRGYPESLIKCFDKEDNFLVVYVSLFYQYIVRGTSTKLNDRVFGKQLHSYIEKRGFARTRKIRNNTFGRRIEIDLTGNGSAMKSAMKNSDGTFDGTFDGTGPAQRNGYSPYFKNEDEGF